MRAVARVGCSLTPLWLGVHVVRELNLDADRLSHPHMLDAVLRDASKAWARVVHLRLHADEWRQLQLLLVAAGDGVPSATAADGSVAEAAMQ